MTNETVVDDIHGDADWLEGDLFEEAFLQTASKVIFWAVFIHESIPEIKEWTHDDEAID